MKMRYWLKQVVCFSAALPALEFVRGQVRKIRDNSGASFRILKFKGHVVETVKLCTLSIVFVIISSQGRKMTGRARARARGRACGQETVQHVGAAAVSALPFSNCRNDL